MSYIKKPEEIEMIIKGGALMGEILEKLEALIVVGASAFDIDQKAEKLIREAGGIPAFKGYRSRRGDTPFPATLCFSLNNEVVHGIPTKDKFIKSGDLVSLDIGMQWPAASGKGPNGNGFFTDTALTVVAGKRIPKKHRDLMDVTRESLEYGISAAKLGGTVADIGRAIEDYLKSKGNYGIVRDLVGHGVGHAVHEDPHVPNFYNEEYENWILREGAVLALEPMITLGTWKVKTADDGWSVLTADGSMSAHFEHTIVISKDGPLVVTRRPSEK